MAEREDSAPKPNPFQVVDRRHWASTDEEDEEQDTKRADKPSYVAKLEQALLEKDRKLKEIARGHLASADEVENAKERIRKEAGREAQRGRREMLGEFLDVLDNLERAIVSAVDSGDVQALVDGVTMVREQFIAKLAAFGVEIIPAEGEPFDPAVHEALQVVPVDDPALNNLVVAVVQNGYKMDDELIRPAAVIVARYQDTTGVKAVL